MLQSPIKIYLCFLLAYNCQQSDCQLVLTSCCTYPGYVSTYECTFVGQESGSTVWTGSAFDCISEEIVLLHDQFLGAHGECNDGSIVGQSLKVENGHYTSQLLVNITTAMAGKSIECIHDDPSNITIVGSLNITVSEIFPPSNISWPSDISSNSEITFKWSQAPLGCSIIHYNIIATNCGSCPTTTDLTNVTCTNIPAKGGVCTFAVQTVFCENITLDSSNTIVTLTQTDEEGTNGDLILLNLTSSRVTLKIFSISTPAISDSTDAKFYAALASAIFFAFLFTISTIVFITVTIYLTKRKEKLQITIDPTAKANIQGTSLLPEHINVTENVAYHTSRLASYR